MITVIEDFLSEEELALARDVMKESTFVDGSRTAGYRARRVKNNEQVSWSQSVVREFQDHVLERIHSHPRLSAICLPRRVSRPLVSRSREGMGYGLHVDDAQIGGLRGVALLDLLDVAEDGAFALRDGQQFARLHQRVDLLERLG